VVSGEAGYASATRRLTLIVRRSGHSERIIE
jgi:hypothetical protein